MITGMVNANRAAIIQLVAVGPQRHQVEAHEGVSAPSGRRERAILMLCALTTSFVLTPLPINLPQSTV
jgi:hypothetical protein